MATTKSPLELRGSIKGLRFYRREGCPDTIVGEKGGANVNLIRNSDAFDKTRKAENEFRGRCKLAKSIRGALGQWSGPIVDRFLQARIAGILQQVQNMDNGPKGLRPLNLSQYKEVLSLINYHYYKPLNELLFRKYSVETSEDRRSVTVTLKGFNPKLHIKAPAMASHFQFCLSICTVSDYRVYSDTKKYLKTSKFNRIHELETEWIPVNGSLMEDIALTVKLPDDLTLTDTHTVLRAFGIVFGKMMLAVEPIRRDRGSIAFLGAV